jgi:hypothetical protein
VWATGDVLLHGDLPLLVKASSGIWKRVVFLADSGTEMTTVPAFEAKHYGFPMPQGSVRGLTHAQTGLAIRSGYIRVKVVGMDATEYVFPCYFLGDPDVPFPTTQPQGLAPRCLLGLTGVITKLKLSFDGDPAPGAPHGIMIVEKK